jgi:hypothetical protein
MSNIPHPDLIRIMNDPIHLSVWIPLEWVLMISSALPLERTLPCQPFASSGPLVYGYRGGAPSS